jgi:eukaryotic-like serine/threonine-protein kinase
VISPQIAPGETAGPYAGASPEFLAMTERTIFLAVLDIGDPAARAAYLDAACAGDPALRGQVEQLLKAHQEPGPFMARPAAALVAADEEPVGERPGTVIGPYTLLEQLGEGGMGLVFVAEQTQPVRRQVALKVIKPGMDTRQVVARFEAERQALALMDHPHIAKVHDGGETAGGRPYFVMELVRGVPITQFCDDNRLTPRERLGLFVSVCQAVQHAHTKGVIHRDLKPSNVLVTSHDGTPVVKVIDFGVAKAVGQQLTDKTVDTQFTQLVGTPLYMSPEQAGLGGLDIDTRTDVYALGVLLYELLTGTTPFDKERLAKAGYDEIRRIIREEEPARPSSRASTLGQAAVTASVNRRTDSKRLSRQVRGELDWIVMKALEKDRDRRYETASAFAADVQRYLHDEPVQAGPPSAAYRLWKFVKRHRGPALAAAVVVLTLVAGIMGTTLGLVEARVNAERATAEEGKAKEALDQSEQNLLRAESLLYGSQINLAQQAWESNQGLLAANHYLASCPRDFRGWEHDYLFTLFNRGLQTLHGHSFSVRSVAFSPDGQRLATASDDQTARVWDAATGREILSLRGHQGGVSSVAFSPDGRRLLSGSYDQAVRVWDLATGRDPLTLKGHSGWVSSVAFSPDGQRLASGSHDQTARVWDAATGREILSLRGHQGGVSSVAFSPDGRRLLSGSGDKTVKVWDAVTGQELLTLQGHQAGVSNVALSLDGQRIVSSGYDKRVKVWDAATGQLTLTLEGHTDRVTSVAVSPDRRRAVSGSFDRTVKVWDAATPEDPYTFKGHGGPVLSVCFSPDGQRVASASADRTVQVWDVPTSQETLTLKGHQSAVLSVAFSPDGKHIFSGSLDGTVKMWDAATRQEIRTLRAAGNVAVSPDGKRLVTNSSDNTVKVWDAATGQETQTLKGHTGPIDCVAFSPDGRRIVSGSQDKTAIVWDAATGQETLTLRGHQGGVRSVAFSPDGRRLVSGSYDQTVRVWDAATGQEIHTLRGHTEYVTSVAFTPDGRRIVSGSGDQSVKLWDAATGQETLTLRGHTGPVTCVAVSPDGQRIVCDSHEKTLKVWNAATGYETLTLKGHTSSIHSVAFSPDGQRLVSGSADRTVKIWDASMSQPKP